MKPNKYKDYIVEILAKEPLSLLRIVLAYLVTKTVLRDLVSIADTDFFAPELVHKSWFMQIFPDYFIELVHNETALLSAWVIALAILIAFGIFGRAALILMAFTAFYVSGVNDGIGFFDHDIALSSQVCLILGLIPNSMNISVDRYFLKKSKKEILQFNSTRKWGINLLLLLLAATYFTAGLSKLRYGGFEWLDGKTLSFYFENHVDKFEPGDKQLIIGWNRTDKVDFKKTNGMLSAITYGNYRGTRIVNKMTKWMAQNRWIMIFLSVFSVVFELSGFLLFVNPRIRNIFLITAILFHTSIGIFMGLYFTHYRVICFFLMDWKQMATDLTRLETILPKKNRTALNLS